jgi:uncharacterized protein YjlB
MISSPVEHYIIKENGLFPNNDKLPVLLYKNVLALHSGNTAKTVEDLFEKNVWSNSWRNGIFNYHHYHSITHEVLGVYKGSCSVALGGDDANLFFIKPGDVLVIPAGVAHKNVESTNDFACVGAYPGGSDYDIKKGTKKDKEEAVKNLKKVRLPETDPVYGKGALQQYWKVS